MMHILADKVRHKCFIFQVLPSGAGFGSVAGGNEGVTCGIGSYFFSTGLGFSTESDLYDDKVRPINTTSTKEYSTRIKKKTIIIPQNPKQ